MGGRVLLVDDEKQIRQTIKLALKMNQHEVTEVESGAAALDQISKQEFDLVITDFEMPNMKGDELARRIKELLPNLPILMVSAFAIPFDPRTNPVDALLTKPFELRRLSQAVQALLAH